MFGFRLDENPRGAGRPSPRSRGDSPEPERSSIQGARGAGPLWRATSPKAGSDGSRAEGPESKRGSGSTRPSLRSGLLTTLPSGSRAWVAAEGVVISG